MLAGSIRCFALSGGVGRHETVDDVGVPIFNADVPEDHGALSVCVICVMMPAMDFADVRACLEKDGWPIEMLSDSTIRSFFRGGERIFPLFIHREAEYMTFAVIPFLHLPKDEDAVQALVGRLLRLNRDMNMAKFSTDEDDDVILSVEYRLEDLDPSEVRDAVDVLSFYAEKYRAELTTLAGA